MMTERLLLPAAFKQPLRAESGVAVQLRYSIRGLDPNDQKSLEGMQKMEKEESPTDATVELDGDDMEGSGEDGDLEGSDSEAAQWADQEQWFGMQ
ncbi:hypothetical protein PFLUV_G00066930 [Perca fluviatilis]|uniref:Uncharacterized protein n=1 Tax=Perca fluviatilis TaxID=8168 RepID=A0A6A5FG87_PERFL|nr:hypothetical protein PFLUV_G00066930 [Perca fluviatilis]